MTNLGSRLAVAAVGVPAVLALLWPGGWWLFALLAFAALFSLHEFWLMTRSLRPLTVAGYAGAFLALLGAELGGLPWAVGGFLATLPLTFALKSLAETKTTTIVSVATATLAACWIGLGLGFVVLLRDIPEHAVLFVFTVLLAVWANDTLAYFAGRTLGRHKMAPRISPGKTWEGALGAFAAILIYGAAASFVLQPSANAYHRAATLLFVVALTVLSIFGDLLESWIKRGAGAKDSGSLLPGHGGVLDRIDSLTAGLPFAALYFLPLLAVS